ncbi:NUDIX domain-containing protein [Solicola gregarius]|uniref:NUDIX domain-containing protein n=1 Tax=Solicola gregarius TaxID=2908642 RepID=A0AA46TG14_9ACTN|nr:NUDIX domain-containing protein [Solicola gregarius]UYM04570.1 NUDIX domain-containing protein [Solicola gregarius]
MSAFSLIPASYVALRRSGDVLLQVRQNTGFRDGHWALLAGHVEPEESAHEAAAREAYEEAGVEVRTDDLVALTTVHRTLRGGGPIEQRCDFFFATTRWTGEPSIREPHKSAAMRWWPIDALPEPMVPHERAVLDALAAGDVPPIMTSGF